MKCRKGDWIKTDDGDFGKVITGTNSEHGMVTVNLHQVKIGYTCTCAVMASRIVEVRKGKRIR